jgi:integrase
MAHMRRAESGIYRIKFRFGHKQYLKSLKTTEERTAIGKVARIEELLEDLGRGRLELPPGADLWQFLLSDGRRVEAPKQADVLTLVDLRKWYFDQLPDAKPSEKTDRTHFGHFERILGNINLTTITGDTLQRFVNTRAKAGIKPDTIKKELTTLRAVWNRAKRNEKAACGYPSVDLRLPRRAAKEPFRTWAELKASGKPAPWENLYLRLEEIETFLDWAKQRGPEWFYPALVFAAHTGARRSEIHRSRKEDFDFSTLTVNIREKKRSKTTDTFRTVPMTTRLASVMREWFVKNTGEYAVRPPNDRLSLRVMVSTFRRVCDDTDYAVLKGWHTFRHSFASNLAAAGTDQRLISEFMGHQTPEQEQRYRHLFPETKRKAVAALFR